jgi:uncharacterized protein (TIGR04255 family)
MVAFELRIPHTLSLADRDAQAQVWERIKERVPITQPEASLQVTLGAPGMVHAQGPLRMLDRGRTLGVVVGAEALVVESTGYRCYEEFCEFLRYVLAAMPSGEVAGFGRIGLRYVNEIRVPGITLPADWDGLVASELLADTTLSTAGLAAQSSRGEVEYAGADGLRVQMRHGAATGRLVNAQGPLRTRTQDAGPFFFIDLDSYWENPPECELPEFSTDAIIEKTTRLREPIHHLFETAITDQLRERFRKEPT